MSEIKTRNGKKYTKAEFNQLDLFKNGTIIDLTVPKQEIEKELEEEVK